MTYDRMGRDVRSSIAVLLILGLACSTVWFAAQASQHHADYVKAATAVESLTVKFDTSQSALTRAMAQVEDQAKTLKACRTALGKLAASADQVSQASLVGAKGGVSGKLAAVDLLDHAIGLFKAASAQLSACKG